MNELTIRGAGSGKTGEGSGRVPLEARDSLRSISYARVIDLISEGEIEGLVSGLRSVYLNGTPIQNDDDSFNFTGVTVDAVTGTQGQAPLVGFDATESEFPVSTEVVFATPVIRTVTNPTVDAVRVSLAIPALTLQNTTTGDLTGTSVTIAIDLQANGGGYVAQDLSYEWKASAIQATVNSIGLMISVEWTFIPVTVPGQRYTEYTSVNFDVQYRQIGAGGWTTLKQDSVTNAQSYTHDGRNGPAPSRIPVRKRSYTVTGLAELLYEARAVVTSGSGTVTVTALQVLTRVQHDTITGKTTSTYQRAYRIELTGSPPWDLRMRRITPDSGSVTLQNKTFWGTYAEIIDDKFSYPNSALVGVKIDASQFNAIPTRGYEVKLLKVKIPDNYNPTTRVYTGNWSGTFVVAWTDNPAWCFYDMVTNTRYGLGQFVPEASVDKFGLYTIAQYCDGLVPDGFGSEEPRFTCNCYFQTQVDAFQMIVTLASIFRGMAYWAGGLLTAVQDAPTDPVFLFTEANVENGTFTYSGSAKQARHTVALVSWNDPNDGYKLKPEYVEDLDGIARYGIVETQMTAVGAVSRGQAVRAGKWLLFSERIETEVVTFRCGQDGTYVRPGAIFAVQDQHRAGIRYGGRITAATTTTIDLDQAVTINAGQTYTVQVVLPDGTLDTRTVTTGAGSASTLTVSVAFTLTPVVPAIWLLTSSSISPRLYRALTVAETARHIYEITGVEHNPSKYVAVEEDHELEVPRYSTLVAAADFPQNVTITESLVIQQGSVTTVMFVKWDPVASAISYKLQYRWENGNYVSVLDLHQPSAEIVGVIPGFYEVRVTAFSIFQKVSAAGTASRQIYGKTARPADVQNFIVIRNGETLIFSWDKISDLDWDHYEIRQGTSWEVGVVVGKNITNNRLEITTHVGGAYLIKAIDTSGLESVNVATNSIADNTDINVVVQQPEHTTWLGTHANTQADSEGLTLANAQRWNTLTNTWNTYTSTWYQMGSWAVSGTYVTVPVDLGVVLTSRVEVTHLTQQLSIAGVTWLSLTNPWLTYDDPWEGVPELTSILYKIATSQNGSSYTGFSPFVGGFYTARAYKFQIMLASVNVNYVPHLKQFEVIIDVPDRVVHFENQAVAITGTAIVFSPAFVAVQTVTGSIQGGVIGDTFTVTNKTTAGATINVYSAAGSAKAGVIDLDVFGYGSIP